MAVGAAIGQKPGGGEDGSIEELRKQAQLRGVLNVQLMNRDELVTAIFERRGEREKVLARFLGQIKE